MKSATFVLVALNLAAWCAVALFFHLSPLASQNSALLLRAGAVNGELLREGEWWRVLTSQFLHVHFLHFVFNMAALLLLGGDLEREYGWWRLLVIYLGGGIVGQFLGVIATPALVSSGSSQALMAVAGGAMFGLFKRRRAGALTILILTTVLAVQIILDVASTGYIKAGHLGGFFAGAVIGFAVCRPVAARASHA